MSRRIKLYVSLTLSILIGLSYSALAQTKEKAGADPARTFQNDKQATPQAATEDAPTNVLSDTEWQRVDAAVEKSLTWLASQQEENGEFRTLQRGQPGMTSLCNM